MLIYEVIVRTTSLRVGSFCGTAPLRSVPNQDENPLISRNKGFTSGFWGLISEHKEGLGPHPSLISEIRGCTQVYLWCTRVYLYCTFAEIPGLFTAKYCKKIS